MITVHHRHRSVVAVPGCPDEGCYWTVCRSPIGDLITTSARISLTNTFYHQLLAVSSDGRGALELRPTRVPEAGSVLAGLPALVQSASPKLKHSLRRLRSRERELDLNEAGRASAGGSGTTAAIATKTGSHARWKTVFDEDQRMPTDSILAVDDPIEQSEGSGAELVFSIECVKSSRYLGLTLQGGGKGERDARRDAPMVAGTHTRRFCTADAHNVSSFEIVERAQLEQQALSASRSEGASGRLRCLRKLAQRKGVAPKHDSTGIELPSL